MEEVEEHRALLYKGEPRTPTAEMLALELDVAARMAVQSCRIMLWQQALAAGKRRTAREMAQRGIRELRDLDSDFETYRPLRNKGTTAKCSAFLEVARG